MKPLSIKDRLETVRASIEKAAQKSGRTASDITLVAVTKGVVAESVREAAQAGISIFGENKVQEAEPKIASLSDLSLQWHMVGHLQTNKLKTALGLFGLVQSVDSVRLAKEMNETILTSNQTASVLLEVNISGEPKRYGFGTEAIYSAVEAVAGLQNVHVLGLMGMAPHPASEDEKRGSFKKLRGIFSVCKSLKSKNLEMKYLSMGMSDDFEIAIEEGANMVRIGKALFQ